MLKAIFGLRPGRARTDAKPVDEVASADANVLLDKARDAYEHGELGLAQKHLEQVVAKRFDLAEAHFLLGLVHDRRQRWEDAADCFNLAAHFGGGRTEAEYQLGLIAMRRGALPEAQRLLEKTVLEKPQHGEARVDLGKLLLRRGKVEEAEAQFRAAIAANPNNAQAMSNLGFVLVTRRDRPQEALAHIDDAIAIAPDFADAFCNRAMALQYLGRCEEAVAASNRALELQPQMAEARLNRALALLMMGEFAAGWRDYEVRRELNARLRIPLPGAEWDGAPLRGRRLLVQAEQGLGDEIMFASCLPDVMSRAESVTVECNRKLAKLYARSFPRATIIGEDQSSSDLSWVRGLPPPDYRVPIGSLPRYFRNSAADFPPHSGYLQAEPKRVAYWRARLDALGAGLKVGLSWRGGSIKQLHRSIDLTALLPLLTRTDIHYVSLQYTDCTEELRALHRHYGIKVHHWQEAIDDYDETAALVAALDQIVSVQTAVAHLAGALGRPIWVMVPAVPEWRYQRCGEHLPWYPSLRMFRQQTLGAWEPVIERIADALARLEPPSHAR